MTLSERISQYAFHYWKRHRYEKWPTVREAARALRIRQVDIQNEEGSGDFCLSSYYISPREPLGSHMIEAMTEAVDAEWKEIYKLAV